VKVTTFKRCRCRGEDGRELANRCAQLRRADGSLNPRHGTWSWNVKPTGEVRIRRGAYRTEAEAYDAGRQVADLLAIPDPGQTGTQARKEILTLVDEALRRGEALPDADTIRRRIRTGQPILARVSLGEYLDGWLAGKRDIRPTTRAGYESNIRVYLKPHLGHIPIDKLRTAHVSAMFDAIDEENDRIREVRRSGTTEERRALRYRKPVGPATKQRIRATLRSALSDAMNEQLVTVNVAKMVKLESGKRPKGLVWTKERVARWHEIREQIAAKEAERAPAIERRDFTTAAGLAVEIAALRERERPSPVMVWTPVQLGQFLDFIADHRLYGLFHVIAFRGLRRGEACGLRWVDLDLDEAVATVAEQLVTVNHRVSAGEPKSDAGSRDVALDAVTVKVLRAHRKRQIEDRLKWSTAWVDSGRVFVREDGSELHPADVTVLFGDLVEAAGLPPIRLHDLRHGAASIAKLAGIDTKVISEMLGHSSRKITDDTYTSIFVEVAREAAEAAAAVVPRAVAVAGEPGPAGLRVVSKGRSTAMVRNGSAESPQVRG
jgi:integrase